MQAIEFTSQIEDGHIAVPKTIRLAEGQAVRVLILVDETAAIKDAVASDEKNVWKRTSGGWQGNPLVRELQGQNEVVQMQAPVSRLKDSDLQKAPQALMRAAEKARQLAEQTGTPLVVRHPATSTAKTEKPE
jgi:hypothetical protein